MKPVRPYRSSLRSSAVSANRQRVLDAASRLLEEAQAQVSMEAVAKAAGVSRLTIYKQFSSRRGLLEAVFDDHAMRGGIKQLISATENPDPLAGLDTVVDILCDFWAAHPLIARLQDAARADPELARALESRQERRREAMDALVGRIVHTARRRADAVDLIAALVSPPTFRAMSQGRSAKRVAALLKNACRAVLGEFSGLRQQS